MTNKRNRRAEKLGLLTLVRWVAFLAAICLAQPVCTLTAAQPDIRPPVVLIASPVSGRQLSSPNVTVRGRAQDNVALEKVYCAVNDGPWVVANGTSSWSVELPLEAGNNLILAYAVDTSGLASRTVSVRIDFTPTAALTVSMEGSGLIRSNYNNHNLALGRRYTMTAQGKDGFAFSRWTSNTDTESTNATISFLMQENLHLTAHFKDRARPVVRMTSPRREQVISSVDNVFYARGWAQDNAALSEVRVRLNADDWQSINVPPGTKRFNWEVPVALQPGRNRIRVYARDEQGNQSFTYGGNINFIQQAAIVLVVEGQGTVTKSFSGDVLTAGKSYTVRATPKTGYVFNGWFDQTGALASSSPSYTFVMQPQMTLRAVFAPSPFLQSAGRYVGLFYPANDFGEMSPWLSSENSGKIDLTASSDGAVLGTVTLRGKSLPFSGQLAADGTLTIPVPQPGAEPLALSLQASTDEAAFGGELSKGDEWRSSILARRRASGGGAYSGRYSLMIVGCDSGSCFVGPPVPFGDSYATVKVDSTGALKARGTLSDGVTVSQDTFIAEGGYWPVCFQPYAGQGLVIGWLNVANFLEGNSVIWEKPARLSDNYYPEGFSSPRVAVVSPYVAPMNGESPLGWTYGYAIINSGNLPAKMLLTNTVRIVNNEIRDLGGDLTNLTFHVNALEGTFSGSFNDPVTGQPTPFSGIIIQSSSEFFHATSGGWFLGTNAGGTIRLRVAENPLNAALWNYQMAPPPLINTNFSSTALYTNTVNISNSLSFTMWTDMSIVPILRLPAALMPREREKAFGAAKVIGSE